MCTGATTFPALLTESVRFIRTNINIRNILDGKPKSCVLCGSVTKSKLGSLRFFCNNLFIVGADTTHDQVVGYGHLFELCPPCVRCLNVSYSYYNPHFPPSIEAIKPWSLCSGYQDNQQDYPGQKDFLSAKIVFPNIGT